MRITVILCTFNRCQSLAKALDSIATSVMPENTEWEVLVVDNNSSDGTRAVVEDFCRRYPGRFRYLFEPQQGKSFALNSGIRESRGGILAFVDDDVVVEPTWLRNLTATLMTDEWAGAGGRILPQQSFSPPRWLALHGPYDMGGVLVFFDRGEEPREFDWVPYGTNMAFRKVMFEKYGSFRSDLGPKPGSQIRGEDTEFGRRLWAHGERLWYEPSAVVYHEVPERRLRKRYFLEWWFAFGRAIVREWGRGPDILRIPRPYFSILKILMSRMPLAAARWMFALQPQRRFFFKAELWRIAGEVAEFFSLARSSNEASK